MKKQRQNTEEIYSAAYDVYNCLQGAFIPLCRDDPQFKERWDLLYSARKLRDDIFKEHINYVMSTITEGQEFLTKEQAAAYFNRFEDGLDYWIKNGKIHIIETEKGFAYSAQEVRKVVADKEADLMSQIVRLTEESGGYDREKEMDWEGPWRLCNDEIIREGHPDW